MVVAAGACSAGLDSTRSILLKVRGPAGGGLYTSRGRTGELGVGEWGPVGMTGWGPGGSGRAVGGSKRLRAYGVTGGLVVREKVAAGSGAAVR